MRADQQAFCERKISRKMLPSIGNSAILTLAFASFFSLSL